MPTPRPDPTTNLTKSIDSAFLLDRAKLSRILNIVEERLNASEVPFEPKFEVLLANKKTIKLSSPDDLLTLDNTVKNPIQALAIKAGGSANGEKLEVKVRLGEPALSVMGIRFGDAGDITLEVTGSNPKSAAQFFAEMEEQVERTVQTGWFYRRIPGGLLFTLPVILSLAIILVNIILFSGSYNPSTRDRNLAVEASRATTDSEKINFLFEIERQKLDAKLNSGPTLDLAGILTPPALVIAVPFVLVLTCIIYLRRTSYPRAVFLWGDYSEHYDQLVARRKTIWSVIVASLLIGVLSSLFASGVAQLLGLG